MDLGCGHGTVTRHLSASFDQIFGIDPSPGMISQARLMTSPEEYFNIEYKESAAENLAFLADNSIDAAVAGQAAHWFKYPILFGELQRVLRQDGTIAFWGYKDHCFMNHPRATKIFHDYCHNEDEQLLGSYWSQPGRSIVENKLRDIQPPVSHWKDIQRIEYEPQSKRPMAGEGTMFMSKTLRLGDCMNYIRTFSAFHAWQENNPEKKRRREGGKGDVVDELFDEMISVEPDWQKHTPWEGIMVNIEWGSGLVLARKA